MAAVRSMFLWVGEALAGALVDLIESIEILGLCAVRRRVVESMKPETLCGGVFLISRLFKGRQDHLKRLPSARFRARQGPGRDLRREGTGDAVMTTNWVGLHVCWCSGAGRAGFEESGTGQERREYCE